MVVIHLLHVDIYRSLYYKHNNSSLTTPKEIRTSEAKINWNIIRKMKSLKKITIGSHQQSDSGHVIETEIEDADIILDGLLGTGVKGQIREPFSFAIDKINHSKAYTGHRCAFWT